MTRGDYIDDEITEPALTNQISFSTLRFCKLLIAY